MMTS